MVSSVASLSVKIDASSFIKWATELSSYKFKLAAKNALNRASRLARTSAIEVIALDEGISQARAKQSISKLNAASPSRLVTTWSALKQRIGILSTAGAKFSKGVGLTASTFRVTGGGSASLNISKAFVIVANGGKVLLIRKGKGRKAIKGVYAETPKTAMAQDGGAARRIWQKTASTRLPQELTSGLQAVLNGASPPSDSGTNN